ncbi:hypothetical protein E1A91_D02G157000v1 [Gossypium mustelinum]|uniref:Uncharacterized protein n=1 Tax=Gossypium mustelinum TaxID=34275 RepID=A0A5D2VWD7_GOSMU|nr:hypothetical protein E1A91_D02G157000v1 [Gossypium mustelinum]
MFSPWFDLFLCSSRIQVIPPCSCCFCSSLCDLYFLL